MVGNARPRKQWGQLSKRTRDRYARQAGQYGISRDSARAMYNRGTFRPDARTADDRIPRVVQRQPGKYLKSVYVLAQSGISVERVQVNELSKAERQAIAKHWRLINAFLNHGSPIAEIGQVYNEFRNLSLKRIEQRIRAYEGKYTGGSNPREFANDPDAIRRAAITDPEEFDFESIYPLVAA